MHLSDFFYELPETLIAHYPLAERSASRLLVLDPRLETIQHSACRYLPEFLRPGDLLVFNDTRVIPARLLGCKLSGGKIEVLIERLVGDYQAWVHVRASKAPKVNSMLVFDQGVYAQVQEKNATLTLITFNQPVISVLDRLGHMPLPPYLKRPDENLDRTGYQTVYADKPGAVAAPTAGLHFDKPLLDRLQEQGIELAYITLHVGAGTFQPVRVDHIENHQMHAEYLEVSDLVCQQIKATKARGGRIVAVGTTSVRALETAASSGDIQPFYGETKIFIYPGYEFRVVDAMMTNFHLSESTLLMLVSAFAGLKFTQHAYQIAIRERYRFYSYGDSMLILSTDH